MRRVSFHNLDNRFVVECLWVERYPEIAAKEWNEALLNLDGNKLAERTCAAQQASVQSTAIWASAFAVLGQQFTGQQTNADISDMRFETTSKRGNSAQVRAYGEIRTVVLAIAQTVRVDLTYTMMQESGKWKWCGETGSTVGGTTLPTNVSVEQRVTIPPSSPEQVAAAQAFEHYAAQNSIQYRNARYETTNYEGTFADVLIIMEVYTSDEGWVEKSTIITFSQLE